jgi:hypothetical protein
MHPNAAYILKELSNDREPVGKVWLRLNCPRHIFERLISQNYDELVREGLRLYGATVSQASAKHLYIEVAGRRYSHISKDVPFVQNTEEYLASHRAAVQLGERSWQPGDSPEERE